VLYTIEHALYHILEYDKSISLVIVCKPRLAILRIRMASVYFLEI